MSQPTTKALITPLQLDVTSDASVSAAASYVQSTPDLSHVDVLLNNAGINSSAPSLLEATKANLAVNVEGAVRVTEMFLPLLRASPNAPPHLETTTSLTDPSTFQPQPGRRLIFVGSSPSSLTHASNPKSQYYGPPPTSTPTQPEDESTVRRYSSYRASKAAVNMLMVEYDKKLRSEGFRVCVADPGLVVTDLVNAEWVRARGAPEASVAGEFFAKVVAGARDADVGRVCGRYGVQEW